MKKLYIYMVIIFFMAFIFIPENVAMASAVTIEATITADNHYALYYGNEDGSSVTFVGRNELNVAGSPGTYNWSEAESFTFDITVGDYIYIAAWSDDASAQGLLGQFVISDWATTILTNTIDWEVHLTFDDKDDGAAEPTVSELGSEISVASWNPVSDYIDHGDNPWGTISGISSEADWIWGSALTPGSDYGEYQIFRMQVIPEPTTMFFLGLGGLALLRKRRT